MALWSEPGAMIDGMYISYACLITMQKVTPCLCTLRFHCLFNTLYVVGQLTAAFG